MDKEGRKEGKKEGRINHGMHTKQSGMTSSWKESEKWMHKKTDGRKRIDDRKEEWENGRVRKKEEKKDGEDTELSKLRQNTDSHPGPRITRAG